MKSDMLYKSFPKQCMFLFIYFFVKPILLKIGVVSEKTQRVEIKNNYRCLFYKLHNY